jgi:hypothetical protein
LDEVAPFTLSPGGYGPASTPNVFEFHATYRGGTPPRQVTLVVDGAYYSLADLLAYPLGQTGPSYHRMTSADVFTPDGSRYSVTIDLRPGCHTYHFEASDFLLNWARTPDQAGPCIGGGS